MRAPSPAPDHRIRFWPQGLWVAGCALLGFAVGHRWDLFERFAAWSTGFEHLQVDELVIAAACASLCLLVLCLRRWIAVERQGRMLTRTTAMLADTQHRLRHGLCASPVVVFSLRREGTCLEPGWISDNFHDLYGYHPAEATSLAWWLERVHPRDRAGAALAFHQAAAGRGTVTELRFRAAGGEYRWVMEELRPSTADDGTLQVMGSWTDITRRREAEEALRRSETRFRAVFSGAGVGMLLANLDGGILEPNPAVQELLGRPREALLRGDLASFIHPDDLDAGLAAHRRLLAGEQDSVTTEHRYLRDDDEVVWATTTLSMVRSPQGEPLHIVAIIQDSTARKLAEQARVEIEERYRLLADRTEDVVSLHDADGTFIYASPSVTKATGYAPEELIGRKGVDVVHPDDRQAALAAVRAAEHSGGAEVEWRMHGRDGTGGWFASRVAVLRGPDGRVQRLLISSRDIDARKRAEEAVRFQAGLLDVVEQAVVATDLEGTVVYWNNFAEQLYGWTAAEARGRKLWEVAPTRADDDRDGRWQRVRDGGTWTGEMEVRRRDGTSFPAMAILSPIRDAEGTVTGAVGVSSDLTAFKQLEQQFRQAQKMEAVGRLAGGVAHDFNNMLTAIRCNAQLMLADLPELSTLRQDVEEIDRAAGRAADLTRQLLAFSRSQVLQPRLLDLNAAVGEVEPMLRRLIGEDVHFTTVLAPGLGTVRVDPAQVEQIILNLVVNARDAMPQGGDLRIETRNLPPGEGGAKLPDAAHGVVALSVTDTGCGMSREIAERIFEPFFTTKAAGTGTGLGLSTVYGIVSQSGGQIEVRSRPGAGTTFCVYLPRVDGASARPARAVPGESAARGSETLLLVEDEETVAMVAYKALTRCGYRVLRAGRPSEALSLFARHADEIDLVVTDMVMPEMSGRELAERLQGMRAGLPVLFTSGYMEPEVTRGDTFAAEADFLAKPFSPEVLGLRVRQALERARRAA